MKLQEELHEIIKHTGLERETWTQDVTRPVEEQIIQIIRRICGEVISVVEQFEDESDERYGYAKMWNTMLQRLEDEQRQRLQSLTGKDNV